jgi:hypothetical protein
VTTQCLCRLEKIEYYRDDYLVGIKNRKGAEGAGTYKHMAGEHQKREKEKMSVSKGRVKCTKPSATGSYSTSGQEL